MRLKIKTLVILISFVVVPVKAALAAETSSEAFVLQLTQNSLSVDEKWEISRKIVAQGKSAIPTLIRFSEDPRVIGLTYPTGGECINFPPNQKVPEHCQHSSQKETLGDRATLLLYQIITPSYTSPYATRAHPKDLRGPPFVIKDWKKWWDKIQALSLDQIHQRARELIDEYWLRGYQKGSVVWK